jgi:hypothetical protein
MTTTFAEQSGISSIRKGGTRVRSWLREDRGSRPAPTTKTTRFYLVTDLLHRGHTVRVRGDMIAATVSGWLAELGADSPLITDLAHAVESGNWRAVYAIGERLSVHVAIAACQ